MFIKEIQNLILRDLKRLEKELLAFNQEEDIWKVSGSIKNSSGHLTLHLCGNLRHFIGHVLGDSLYVRNRENEFNSEPISREQLISQIPVVINEVSLALEKLSENELSKIYPILVFKEEMTTQFFLIHLSGHLNYHLGQINTLRRMVEEV